MADFKVSRLDHIVLTVEDIKRTTDFYSEMLGMNPKPFADGGRIALHFGDQKINLHEAGNEFLPNAGHATPGSQDICLVSETPVEAWAKHFAARGVEVIRGPVVTHGALGEIWSVYIRDPDLNLVEITNYRD